MLILINGLQNEVSIGVHAFERAAPQELRVDLALDCAVEAAAKSDRLEDTVDYTAIEDCVVKIMKSKHFDLVERLVDAVGTTLLAEFPLISSVTVRIAKPGALKYAPEVAVEEEFSR